MLSCQKTSFLTQQCFCVRVPACSVISLVNRCQRAITAAVRYQSMEQQWVTGGYFKLRPGESKQIADTSSSVFFPVRLIVVGAGASPPCVALDRRAEWA